MNAADVIQLLEKSRAAGANPIRGTRVEFYYEGLLADLTEAFEDASRVARCTPIPMRLHCPACGELHIDDGEFATKIHATHACQECGNVWRPAVVPTVGVMFLPGFKNEVK